MISAALQWEQMATVEVSGLPDIDKFAADKPFSFRLEKDGEDTGAQRWRLLISTDIADEARARAAGVVLLALKLSAGSTAGAQFRVIEGAELLDATLNPERSATL
jgi:hypothetical protein